MHLNIKNHEAHRMASELAALTGESLTCAVTTALHAELARERRRRDADARAERLLEIGRRYAALPDAAGATPDEVMDYDPTGAPV